MAAARLRVSVATPDGVNVATRGLGPWLARIAPASARGDLSIAIVSDRRMRALNRQFRGKDAVTDVLSFPSDERGFLGDIVIAGGVSKRQARGAGHTAQTELRVLALHGLLHLLGYDHEEDDGKMARAEMRLRKKAGLKEGLIERRHPSTRLRSLRAR
jgi:probable rRNA maturation factor